MKTVKHIKYILLIVVAFSFASCERDAKNVDLPSIQPQLVVQGVLSPQEPETRIYVSLSSPVFGSISSQDWIRDATVQISDGTTTVPLVFEFGSFANYYVADSVKLKIHAGKTYTLWVSTPDGKTVNSKCTVPFPADTTSLKYNWDTTSVYNANAGGIERTVRLNMEWTDFAGGANYYRAGADVISYPLSNPSQDIFERMYNNTFSDLLTDKNKDGGIMARRDLIATISEYFGGQTGSFSFRPKGIKMYLVNCDENYYKFHESANRNDSGDPFSEPVLVHNNIVGGLGYFGACNQFIKEVRF
jgi:hypothetical protein